MPDNADLIEKYEDELQQLIQRMRNDGIRDEVIHPMLIGKAEAIELRIIARAG